jgi:hypothetical protein
MNTTRAKPATVFVANARPLAGLAVIVRLAMRLAPAVAGLACWAYSIATLRLDSLGLYGLLATVDAWFYVGLALLLGGFAVELARKGRALWILVLYVLAIVVVIHATVPILFHVPEYAWVYKHIGVAQSLKLNGRVTLPHEIYQAWPAFFSAVAGISSLSGAGPLSFAAWAPLFFELANCLVLLAIFRSMTRDSRVPILAVLLFQCFISWVGQDYLSPQAFAYLLWLGLVLVVLHWLSGWTPHGPPHGRLDRLRGHLLRGFEYRPAPRPALRITAAMATIAVFFVIVSSHQLTPYIGLAGLAGLAALGLLRPRWLLPVLAGIAIGFLLPRYHIVSSQYGGLFSGFNVVENASGSVKLTGSAAQAFTARVVHVLALAMWLTALALVARSMRSPGRVAIPAVLGFSPFVILLFQSYGGEAIYRVFLFSAPWCAYLIATAIIELRWSRLRSAAILLVPTAALLAGLQGLYGPVVVDTFSQAELTASQWLYGHTPRNATLALAVENFPVLETADYESHELQLMPSDPQLGSNLDWLNAGDMPLVDQWMASLKGPEKFLVVSRSMAAYSAYYGFPTGYVRLTQELPSSPDWTVYFKNSDVTIYRFTPAG